MHRQSQEIIAMMPGSLGKGLVCEISHKLIDSEWDSFVQSVPRGDHLQSSPWAVFKASYGWSPIRISLKRDGQIIAGVQILRRRLFGILTIAHVLQGPVLSSHESGLLETMMQQLTQLIRTSKISYLVIQPACDCSAVDVLEKNGFHTSEFLAGTRATLIIDLSYDMSALLKKMRRTTRNNIRIGHDQGIWIREGSETDLAFFHRLLEATGRRHKGVSESKEYYLGLWKDLGPSGHVKLLLAGYQAEILSGVLLVPYGNTVVMKAFGWRGGERWLRPNELLIWTAIGWSKENGYHHFDLNGIAVSAALALLSGQSLPESEKSTTSRFKLGFGGSIVLLPATYEYIPQRAMSLLFKTFILIERNRNLSPILHRIFSSRIMRKGSPLRADV
jgi:peptidoglycan pentaglycine glycine transferase (the first glycine)